MSNSYPSTSLPLLAVLGGITLLALALRAGPPQARAADRAPSPVPSHSTRDLGHPAATGLETCPTGCPSSAKPPAAGTQAVAPSAGTPAAARTQASPRDKATGQGGGNRQLKRSGDGRVMPRAPRDEPRRGGVGTLIGITFA